VKSFIQGASNPKGLYVLFFLEASERLSYWGIQSALILYLIKHFLFTENAAYSLFGAYTALAYAAALIGGYIADKYISFKKAIVFGAVLIVLGNLLLAYNTQNIFYLGLVLIIGGNGLIKPNSLSQLGTLYDSVDRQRDKGFTIFYVGTNIGGILGPILYGIISIKFGLQAAFLMSALLVSINLFVYLFNYKNFKQNITVNYSCLYKIILLYIILLLFFWFFLYNPKFSSYFVTGVGLAVCIWFAYIFYKGDKQERESIITIFAIISCSVFFFACLFQCSSSLILFVEEFVDREIFGLYIPTQFFVAIQPLFVIVMAPLINRIWSNFKNEPSTLGKINSGVMCNSLGFLLFFLASYQANIFHQASIELLILGNLFLGIGELCIAPPALAAITRLSPLKTRSTLIGCFYLSLSFSGYLAGIIAKTTNKNNLEGEANKILEYMGTYLEIFYISISISIIIFLLNYFIFNKKLIKY